jgi:cellulose synthase/poly-beta-1,6-N-acetylglucosamine synthase-like glycosyltransferase
MHARLTAVFQRLGVDYEIIFVNDCSPDNAAAVLRDLAERDKKVVVINHTRKLWFAERLHERYGRLYRRRRRSSRWRLAGIRPN